MVDTDNPELIREINSCRSCGFAPLGAVFSLGDLHVSNFVDGGEPSEHNRPLPLELVLCEAGAGGCGLLQLKHTVSPEMMYRNYWYRSGGNRTMSEHLAALAQTAQTIVPLKAGDLVVDIGANDGTLLRAYKSAGITRVGFEPAANLASLSANGTEKIFSDFFAYAPFEKEFGERKAKIITAIAMFYDLDRPNNFVADVKRVLDPNGAFVIEMHYLPDMLRQNSFDACCHEHLEYYALGPLENLLARHGLEVFDVERNAINGGSFRAYIRHKGSPLGASRIGAHGRVEALRVMEAEMGLDTRLPYEAFAERIHLLREKLYKFIKSETELGKKVYVYGASTKGNTLLQFCGLDSSLIPAAAERNPMKWGKRTIATNIAIISEEEARSRKPDYFLVLPWHFLDEFKEREADYLKAGGKFIVPLPEPRIVGHEIEARLV